VTDRELLEPAAKAAGFQFNPTISSGAGLYGCFAEDAEQTTYLWNPLTDDGDALRLAVKLHIDIRHFMYRDNRMDCLVDRLGRGFAENVNQDDPCAATRLAIVRAAAEIGKKMP
jgi:hypothetical protein